MTLADGSSILAAGEGGHLSRLVSGGGSGTSFRSVYYDKQSDLTSCFPVGGGILVVGDRVNIGATTLDVSGGKGGDQGPSSQLGGGGKNGPKR